MNNSLIAWVMHHKLGLPLISDPLFWIRNLFLLNNVVWLVQPWLRVFWYIL